MKNPALTSPSPLPKMADPTHAFLLPPGTAILLVILAVTLIAVWLFCRSGGRLAGTGSTRCLKIIETQALGSREKLALIQAGDQWLLLGVTASAITCLATLENINISKGPPPQLKSRFQALLSGHLGDLHTEQEDDK